MKDEIRVGKTTKVEVRTDKLTGTAGIRFYSSKQSGNQVVVSRQAKQKFALTEALAHNVVKVLLNAHINKTLTEDFVKKLEKKSCNTNCRSAPLMTSLMTSLM